MARIFLGLLLVCLPAAADWSLFKSGPLEVYSNASDDEARRVLATFDQARWLVAKWLGRDELKPLWTVRMTIAKAEKGVTPVRTPAFKVVRDGYVLGMIAKDAVTPEMLRQFVRLLLRDDTKSIPANFEVALADLVSTLEVKAVMLTVGKPPADAARRTRDWARLHMLCVDPIYAGRVRVLFSNLQAAAPLDTAYRNAFEKTQKQMEAEVDRYYKAGNFQPQTISGKPLNPERDYRARVLSEERGKVALADVVGTPAAYKALLNAGFKSPEVLEGAEQYEQAALEKSESAAAWLNAAKEESEVQHAQELLLKAMDLNKRWVEPHVRLAALEKDWGRKAAILKRAVALDERNTALWIQLAEAQQEAKDFAGAALSWRQAERSTTTEAARVKIEARRRDYEQRRLALEAAERKREAEEKQKELDRLKEQAMANIRAAEAKANAGKSRDANSKVVEWWDGPKAAGTVMGMLERVDCVGGSLRLQVRMETKKLATLAVPKPNEIVVTSGAGGDATLGCGVQRPAKKVKVEHNEKNEVLTIEFQ
ncbi:MAG: hypothetical protein IT168_18945 [Bryobacterales bacterium]|nr:hypothetical protein [Bryobacterales bacterium]